MGVGLFNFHVYQLPRGYLFTIIGITVPVEIYNFVCRCAPGPLDSLVRLVQVARYLSLAETLDQNRQTGSHQGLLLLFRTGLLQIQENLQPFFHLPIRYLRVEFRRRCVGAIRVLEGKKTVKFYGPDQIQGFFKVSL